MSIMETVATNDITYYADREVELLKRLRAADQRVAEAERAAGTAYLDDPDASSGAVDAVVRAKTERSAIIAALDVNRQRRLEAVAAKRTADARALRQQAADIATEIKTVEAQVAERVSEINALLATQIYFTPGVGQPLPRTQTLAAQVDHLTHRAEALEVPTPRHGHVDLADVTSVDALIAAMLRHPSEVPTVAEVIDWHGRIDHDDASAARAIHEVVRTPIDFGDRPRRYRLAWKDSKVDYANSFCEDQSLGRKTESSLTGAVLIEAGSFTFRATPPAGV